MEQPLTNNELEHLLNFIGFGRLDAEVWFLGMEEGGGGEKNIRARLKFKKVEDLEEAHKILGITKYHLGKRFIQSTWRGMCCILLLVDGKEPNTENIRNYQADYLGRYQGNTFLCELMPIPKPKMSDWDYDRLLPQFKSSQDYYEKIKPRRIKYLRDLIKVHKPKIVICYGKKYWQDYKELFPFLSFITIGQFLIANNENQLVLLTDHFIARTMNGKFNEIASIINKKLKKYKKPNPI